MCSVCPQVEELDRLNIIHVTGTKGKVSQFMNDLKGWFTQKFSEMLIIILYLFQGSTCAFTEQILRNYGFRTGFYRYYNQSK